MPFLCAPLYSKAEGKEGGRHGGNGVTLHVESAALYSDIALEVWDFTKSRSRN